MNETDRHYVEAAPSLAPTELLKGVVLVTGNRGKLAEARRLCGTDLESVEVDLPEIQSLDLITVLRAKGEEAFRHLQRPLIVEETGLELAAMGGFPGPLVKWMLSAVGAEGIARAAIALGDDRVTARRSTGTGRTSGPRRSRVRMGPGLHPGRRRSDLRPASAWGQGPAEPPRSGLARPAGETGAIPRPGILAD